MKICVVSFHTSPLAPAGSGKSGGMNILIANLYKHLAKSCKVDIYVYGDKEPQKLGKNVLIVYFKHRDFRDFAEAIIEQHHNHNYDILHTHYWLSGIIGMHIQKRIHIPWIHSFHTIERFKGVTQDKSRIEIENEIIRKCDFVMSPTYKETFDLHRLFPQTYIITIPHGVDTNRFRQSPNGHSTLLFVGRVDPIKGLDVLIDSLRLIKNRISLNIVGGPSKGEENYENMKSYAHDLKVNFIGRVKHENLAAYYQNAGIIVVPSYYESFGLVGLEAMASARPVIGFEDTGLSETIGKDAGILVKRNERNLVRAINYLFENQELRHKMGTTGRKKALNYSWQHIAERYFKTYEEIGKK